MKAVRYSGKFKKDFKTIKSRGYRLHKLEAVIDALRKGEQLSPIQDNHPLKGPWDSYWSCHVQGDWILIYRDNGEEIELARTGTHSDLFGR
jgi:mRNA interferase YafQ